MIKNLIYFTKLKELILSFILFIVASPAFSQAHQNAELGNDLPLKNSQLTYMKESSLQTRANKNVSTLRKDALQQIKVLTEKVATIEKQIVNAKSAESKQELTTALASAKKHLQVAKSTPIDNNRLKIKATYNEIESYKNKTKHPIPSVN